MKNTFAFCFLYVGSLKSLGKTNEISGYLSRLVESGGRSRLVETKLAVSLVETGKVETKCRSWSQRQLFEFNMGLYFCSYW